MLSESMKDGQVLGTKDVLDPLSVLGIGSKIYYENKLFSAQNYDKLYRISNWECFCGVVLAVTFTTGTVGEIHGSAVMVAPGIAVAAKHVVEDRIDDLKLGKTELRCIGIGANGLELWVAREIKWAGNCDIVVLAMEYRTPISKDPSFCKAQISTRLPVKGEPVMVAGFKANQNEFEISDGKLEIRGGIHVSTGVVKEHHLKGLGATYKPWPLIEIECETQGGMSGGPAFDQNGFLIGILCSGWSGCQNGPSYISLLWPILGHPILPCWPPGAFGSQVSLLGMDRNHCWIDRPDAIQVNINQETGCITTTYLGWS